MTAATEDLEHALRTLLTALKPDPELSEQHNEMYLRIVAIPRAEAALAKYQGESAMAKYQKAVERHRMQVAQSTHPVDALKQCGVGMSVAQAHFILGGAVQPDGGLYSERVSWLRSREGSKPFPTSILNGEFTADELEAVATWMRAQAQT